jgi:undecaprenyl-diphosphatase
VNGGPGWFALVLLAAVQGLTEFLPVSSSGHLVLANALLGARQPGIALELVLHLGTLLAVVLYFRRDLATIAAGTLRVLAGRRAEDDRSAGAMLILLILGTIPAVLGALLFGEFLKRTFENPREASIELLITGAILLLTRFARRGLRSVGRIDALWIGLAQMVAILPGISRSGTTISVGLFRGVRPEEAARFSFLLSIPAILGGALFDAKEIAQGLRGGSAAAYAIGFAISFALGYASIVWLLRLVRGGRFFWFGLYCLAIGATGLLLLRGR